MYFRLALKNVKKSFQDFMIYFLTLSFSVCLFYTFNSFQSQKSVLDMSESQSRLVETLSGIMALLSIFVSLVLIFLILYANNFLIKRRKKELGLYTLLGMPKRNISKILVYETFIIGLSSLFMGLIAGLFLSQVTTAITASLFRVPLDYHFVFSPLATIITVIAFAFIFFITMLFNTFVLNRYKLIDLLNADRKNDDIKLKHTWMSILMFIASLLFLGYAYYTSLSKGYYAFDYILYICIAGTIGTFLFFLSLSGFLLHIINHSTRLYYKSLNSFVFRQIHANINSNFVSMSLVCIMLLLSIGALSIGLSLNHTVNLVIKDKAPYHLTYFESNFYRVGVQSNEDYILTSKKNEYAPDNVEEIIKNLSIDRQYIKDENYVKTYVSDIKYNDVAFLSALQNTSQKQVLQNTDIPVNVIPLSSFNQELRVRDYDPISLSDGEVYLYSNYTLMDDAIIKILQAKPSFTLYGKQSQVVNDTFYSFIIGTSSYTTGSDMITLVVNDDAIPSDAKVAEIYWNVNHTSNISDDEFLKLVHNATDNVNEHLPEGKFLKSHSSISTNNDVYENNRGLSVIMTYIGIYLGIVFLIASAVILALQQLSQAADNKKRYLILRKIGTQEQMMHRSILIQIAIYFFLPLALAIIHSYVGIRLMNQIVISFGKSDILVSSAITALVITCLYGSYFLVTYMGYKNIVKG